MAFQSNEGEEDRLGQTLQNGTLQKMEHRHSPFTVAEWRIVYLAFKKATVAQATKVKTTKWNCVKH